MDETFPDARDFIPTDEEFDPAQLKFVDPLLTEEELTALTSQPNNGITPLTQHQYATLEEFDRGSNNFHVYFDPTNEGSGPGRRRRKHFQRFVALHPDLARKAFDLMSQYRARIESGSDDLSFGPELDQVLYDAYREMSQLVDIHDSYTTDPKGNPDEYVLKR